ncbi:uncharacterized protein M421DRAFT_95190 [Didymella exigua CBS 183.55]|uniref:DUF6594 domain-containing protein n=1 Tax=Didymella exigua CBS 183.55 TaxID=1150837 RepID=A0A6A5RC52_9PLEO|nr:uncharacterized protein M421DRAFT_95190 [Didymella exigua CBS 183.55]KAF1924860.1 hypothetical protein M421DRAFT_95190 [Didymella exigua CBS 183.55]
MPSLRHSMSSAQSADATVVDPDSPPQSPKKIMGHGEQRACLDEESSDHGTTRTQSVRSSGGNTPKDYKPQERDGWPKLAHKMADIPEFAAFPRFRDLNTRNLLYYQAQLQSLRTHIMQVEENLNLTCYAHVLEDADSEYHELLTKLRCLLHEYNDALLQYSQVSALPQPETYNMSSLRKWLCREDGGNCRVRDGKRADETWGPLTDTGASDTLWNHLRVVLKSLIWSDPSPQEYPDLAVSHPGIKIDGLSRWIVYRVAPLYWVWREKKEHSKIRAQNSAMQLGASTSENILNPSVFDAEKQGQQYVPKTEVRVQDTVRSMSESTALRFTSSLSTVIACLLPVVAIAVLTQVEGERNLLLCITGFAIIFAVGLIALTQGTSSRTEIFAATAAFSAVLVVFISEPRA